jgi:4-amino-4-deoxy-L-arabinose transferase-like glycosyltransferase
MRKSPIISTFQLAVAGLGLALWLGLLLPSLDRNRLQDVDELWHAMPVQNAVLHGDWWPLQLDGRTFFEKPPLMPWLVAATVTLSGQPRASWPYRLWNCLFGAVILVSLVALGSLAGNFWGGFFAAVLLGLQGDFVFHCRFFTMDTPFLGWALLAALGVTWALGGAQRRWAWTAAGWALALAFWCKSWFVLALAPAFGLALLAALPRGERASALGPLTWPLGAAVAAWLLLYSSWVGPEFLRQEWASNVWGRVTGAGLDDWTLAAHVGSYLDWTQRSAPVMLVLALAVPLGLGPKRPVEPQAAFVRMLAWSLNVTWLLGLLVVRNNTINYLLPLEAALALTLGLALFEAQELGVQLGLAVLMLVSALTLQEKSEPWIRIDAWAYLWIGAAAGLALAWGRWRGRRHQPPNWGLMVVACAWLVLHVPDAVRLCIRPLDGHRQLAAVLEANPPREAGEILWAVRMPTRAVDFYSAYKVEHVNSLEQAKGGYAIVFVSNDGKLHFVPARTLLKPKAP